MVKIDLISCVPTIRYTEIYLNCSHLQNTSVDKQTDQQEKIKGRVTGELLNPDYPRRPQGITVQVIIPREKSELK